MTERRPAHETVPDFVERQIREAQARGDFDGLRGAGRPLPDLDKPHDELWWVKRKLRDEQVTELPPALRARRDRDESLAAALTAADEAEVRRIVADVNARIREINRTAWYGPPTSVGPIDVDDVLGRWRRAGAGVRREDPSDGATGGHRGSPRRGGRGGRGGREGRGGRGGRRGRGVGAAPAGPGERGDGGRGVGAAHAGPGERGDGGRGVGAALAGPGERGDGDVPSRRVATPHEVASRRAGRRPGRLRRAWRRLRRSARHAASPDA